MPADWSNGDVDLVEKSHLSNGIPLQHGESGTYLRETQSMLLERIASEMSRLKFYMTNAQVYLVLSYCTHCSTILGNLILLAMYFLHPSGFISHWLPLLICKIFKFIENLIHATHI